MKAFLFMYFYLYWSNPSICNHLKYKKITIYYWPITLITSHFISPHEILFSLIILFFFYVLIFMNQPLADHFLCFVSLFFSTIRSSFGNTTFLMKYFNWFSLLIWIFSSFWQTNLLFFHSIGLCSKGGPREERLGSSILLLIRGSILTWAFSRR